MASYIFNIIVKKLFIGCVKTNTKHTSCKVFPLFTKVQKILNVLGHITSDVRNAEEFLWSNCWVI